MKWRNKLKIIKRIWDLIRPKHFFQYFVKITSWPFFTIFFSPKYYRESDTSRILEGNAVVISNHRGVFDPPILYMTFFSNYMNMVAAESIFKIPIMSLFFKGMGCIPLERDKLDTLSFKTSVKKLRSGEVVCLFPEGKLNYSDELTPFKSSYVLMAMKGNAPIVPVYISCNYRLFRRQKIIIGDPIELKNYLNSEKLSLKTVEYLNDIVYRKMLKLGDLLKEKEKNYD